MIRKTKKMTQIEERVGMPLSDYLIEQLPRVGLSECADQLGVSKATLGYWILKFQLRRETVVLRPGEEAFVRTPDGSYRKAQLSAPIE